MLVQVMFWQTRFRVPFCSSPFLYINTWKKRQKKGSVSHCKEWNIVIYSPSFSCSDNTDVLNHSQMLHFLLSVQEEAEDSLRKRKAVSKIRILKKKRYLGAPWHWAGEAQGEWREGGKAARFSLNSCSLPLLGQNPERVLSAWPRTFLTAIFFPFL